MCAITLEGMALIGLRPLERREGSMDMFVGSRWSDKDALKVSLKVRGEVTEKGDVLDEAGEGRGSAMVVARLGG